MNKKDSRDGREPSRKYMRELSLTEEEEGWNIE